MLPLQLLELYTKTKKSELSTKHEIIHNQNPAPPKLETIKLEAFIFDTKKYAGKGGWKKPEEIYDKESMDFFDNFKGKVDMNSVTAFKRNAELIEITPVNIEYTRKKLIDHNNKTNVVFSVDDFFDDLGGEAEKKEEKEEPFVKSTTMLNLPIAECIYKVNDTLDYPKDKPLWYIYHEQAESSYGPLSSKLIIEMIGMKMLNESSKIRLVDIYIYRGAEQFDFFKVKDIKTDNFHDNIRVSPLALKKAPNKGS